MDEWNPNVGSAIGIDQLPMQTQMQIIELQNNDTYTDENAEAFNESLP
jgi:hypothetical protein